MDTDSGRKFSPVTNWAVIGIFLVLSVGAQHFFPGTVYGIVRDTLIRNAMSPGIEILEKEMLTYLLPIGATAICLNEYGENATLSAATESYIARAKLAADKLVIKVASAGGMSARQKDLINREAYWQAEKFVGKGPSARQLCVTLASRIRAGEFDSIDYAP